MDSPDGAHLNYTADQALTGELGGAQPTQEERMTDEQFAEWIRSTPDTEDGYEGAARLAARYMLEWLTRHPLEQWRPLEDELDWKKLKATGREEEIILNDWRAHRTEYVAVEGVWDRIKEDEPRLADLGLTGFMAGWAWNAARKVLGLGPQKNPAIIEIG